MPGKPQVWYLDLFAGKNDLEAVRRGGGAGHKEINRTNLSLEEAVEKLEQVAECGDAHAQYRMGQLYRDGPSADPGQPQSKAVAHPGGETRGIGSTVLLGKLLLSDDWEVRDPDEGIRWLRQAAENGSHFAAYRLGKEYLEGNTVNKDTTRARIGSPNRQRRETSTPSTCWVSCA